MSRIKRIAAATIVVVVVFDLFVWISGPWHPATTQTSRSYGIEGSQDQIAAARRIGAAEISALQTQLKLEKGKTSSLGEDLALTREQLAQADQDRDAEAAEARGREAALNQQLKTLAEQLSGEQAKAMSLGGELARARDELAQADRDKAQQSAPAAEAEAQISALQTQLSGEQAKTRTLSDDLAHAREQLAEADQEKAAVGATAATDRQATLPQEPRTSEQSRAVPSGERPGNNNAAQSAGISSPPQLMSLSAPPSAHLPILPDGVPARVVLRYARDNEAARAHAISIEQMLRAQGLEVAGPVGTPARISISSVTYFYPEDRGSAKAISDVLATSGPVRSRQPASEPLPRPGTIDVLVAG